ncbi:MAG: hypothetical protein HQL28_06290 [Candidatus Omnitrophica bacterium]|nr:hypothetical protein [Candidatus Omnitrophota bacterium]
MRFLAFFVMAMFLVSGCGKASQGNKTAIGAGSKANSVYVTVKEDWGAMNGKAFSALMASQNNPDLIKKLYDNKLIFRIKPGIIVDIVDMKGNVVVVKPKNRAINIWTFTAAIGKKNIPA